jgi:hypothetical protein
MLCVSCQDILAAKGDVVCLDGGLKFRHHESVQAFQASAEAGCQLCLMAWYQVSGEVLQQALQDTTPVFYTMNEWNRKDGNYELAGTITTDDDTVTYHVEFFRSKSLQGLCTS